jgi:hypothetical protein
MDDEASFFEEGLHNRNDIHQMTNNMGVIFHHKEELWTRESRCSLMICVDTYT